MESEESGEMPWSHSKSLFVLESNITQPICNFDDFINDEGFSVSPDEILTSEDVVENWTLVDAADKLETQSFVDHKCFRLDVRRDRFSQNQVDAIWVRRWKSRRLKLLKSQL